MKTVVAARLRRHIVTTGILLAALTGGAFAAAPATAAPAAVSPPAIPGVPDVGAPGEGAGKQLEPTIDPRGNQVWPDRTALRRGWTEVIAVVDGARIRTRPVSGTVIGLISRNAYFSVSCKVRGRDGYTWGYSIHKGRLGWVRGDLWAVVYYTYPNAPAPRPIPWC
ncbi:hypothetical protein [Actinophytocola sp. NPDC049390]|uniref:hypothetical protein n=1 Tax=Actinophytocola sp. NPDC049390 TaxID=3363894 RepID=UPI0037B0EE57